MVILTPEEHAQLEKLKLARETQSSLTAASQVPMPDQPQTQANPAAPTQADPEAQNRMQKLIAMRQNGGAPEADPAPPQMSSEAMSDPYKKQADAYSAKADQLVGQAAQPRPQPQGFKENLIVGLRNAAENFGRYGAPGGGYYGQEERRQAEFDSQNKTRLEQAKELRGAAQGQEQLGIAASGQANEENFRQGELADREQQRRLEGAKQAQAARFEQDKMTAEANKPVAVAPGATLATQKGAPLYTNPKETTPKDLRHTVLMKNGKPEIWSIDANSQPVAYVGDAQPPTSGAGSGDISVQQGTDETGSNAFFNVNKKTNQAAPVTMVGTDGKPLHSKKAEAPVQLKNQADAAKSTKDMIGIVRNVVKQNPNIIGPASGRAGELMVKFGGDPAGILAAAQGMPEGTEKQTALLAGHLAYLFLNEARATMPGRPAKDYMDFVKSRSAAISQNPQVMEGFLQAAENNSNIQLHNAALAGYDPFGVNAASPAASGDSGFIKPGGALEQLLKR